eukprot:g3566.t1
MALREINPNIRNHLDKKVTAKRKARPKTNFVIYEDPGKRNEIHSTSSSSLFKESAESEGTLTLESEPHPQRRTQKKIPKMESVRKGTPMNDLGEKSFTKSELLTILKRYHSPVESRSRDEEDNIKTLLDQKQIHSNRELRRTAMNFESSMKSLANSASSAISHLSDEDERLVELAESEGRRLKNEVVLLQKDCETIIDRKSEELQDLEAKYRAQLVENENLDRRIKILTKQSLSRQQSMSNFANSFAKESNEMTLQMKSEIASLKVLLQREGEMRERHTEHIMELKKSYEDEYQQKCALEQTVRASEADIRQLRTTVSAKEAKLIDLQTGLTNLEKSKKAEQEKQFLEAAQLKEKEIEALRQELVGIKVEHEKEVDALQQRLAVVERQLEMEREQREREREKENAERMKRKYTTQSISTQTSVSAEQLGLDLSSSTGSRNSSSSSLSRVLDKSINTPFLIAMNDGMNSNLATGSPTSSSASLLPPCTAEDSDGTPMKASPEKYHLSLNDEKKTPPEKRSQSESDQELESILTSPPIESTAKTNNKSDTERHSHTEEHIKVEKIIRNVHKKVTIDEETSQQHPQTIPQCFEQLAVAMTDYLRRIVSKIDSKPVHQEDSPTPQDHNPTPTKQIILPTSTTSSPSMTQFKREVRNDLNRVITMMEKVYQRDDGKKESTSHTPRNREMHVYHHHASKSQAPTRKDHLPSMENVLNEQEEAEPVNNLERPIEEKVLSKTRLSSKNTQRAHLYQGLSEIQSLLSKLEARQFKQQQKVKKERATKKKKTKLKSMKTNKKVNSKVVQRRKVKGRIRVRMHPESSKSRDSVGKVPLLIPCPVPEEHRGQSFQRDRINSYYKALPCEVQRKVGQEVETRTEEDLRLHQQFIAHQGMIKEQRKTKKLHTSGGFASESLLTKSMRLKINDTDRQMKELQRLIKETRAFEQ